MEGLVFCVVTEGESELELLVCEDSNECSKWFHGKEKEMRE